MSDVHVSKVRQNRSRYLLKQWGETHGDPAEFSGGKLHFGVETSDRPKTQTWRYVPPRSNLLPRAEVKSLSRSRSSPISNQILTVFAMSPSRNSIVVVATFLSGAAAINNGLAITPPMGWVRDHSQNQYAVY